MPTFARDLVVLGACLTVERTSLPAFGWLWRNRKRLWAKRREIQAKVKRRRRGPPPTADSFRPMRIAILGTRGIPARYGGFETLAEELSARPRRARPRRHRLHAHALRGAGPHDLARREDPRPAHDSDQVPRHRRPRRRSRRSTPRFERYDAVLVCNAINAASSLPAAALPAHARRVERGRPRAQPPQVERRGPARLPRLGVPLDDPARRGRLRRARDPGVLPGAPRLDSVVHPLWRRSAAPGGARDARAAGPQAREVRPLRLAPRAREQRRRGRPRVPDVPGETPLVVVGDAPYAADYIARRPAPRADPRVLFPGAIYGEGYRELLANAAVYVQATEVGGTHPALVEALGYGRVVCYNATPENEEVAGGAAPALRRACAGDAWPACCARPGRSGGHSVWKERARQRVRERYRWEDVADRYEAVLEGRPTSHNIPSAGLGSRAVDTFDAEAKSAHRRPRGARWRTSP